MERATLAILEQAELEARARRLAATAEVERILLRASARVAEIEAGVEPAIATAVAAARAASDDRLARGLRDLDAERQALRAAADVVPDDAAIERAAAVVVAAVLGEGRP